jgi:hypothetical protein
MSPQPKEKTSIPWPHWMLRAIATAGESALWDLIWSVGGSPPYGNVGYKEAEAVYNLLEEFRGPGTASAEAYAAVRQFVANDPFRRAVIELFRCNDEIISNHESFGAEPVDKGLALCQEVKHDGVWALFLAYRSQLAYRAGKLNDARKDTVEALTVFLRLADQDRAYDEKAAQTAQNAISFTALSGDKAGALKLKAKLEPILRGFDFEG